MSLESVLERIATSLEKIATHPALPPYQQQPAQAGKKPGKTIIATPPTGPIEPAPSAPGPDPKTAADAPTPPAPNPIDYPTHVKPALLKFAEDHGRDQLLIVFKQFGGVTRGTDIPADRWPALLERFAAGPAPV